MAAVNMKTADLQLNVFLFICHTLVVGFTVLRMNFHNFYVLVTCYFTDPSATHHMVNNCPQEPSTTPHSTTILVTNYSAKTSSEDKGN